MINFYTNILIVGGSMNDNNSEVNKNFSVLPIKLLNYVIGVIGSCIAIYLLIINFDGPYRIIGVLLLIIIVIAFYLIYNSYRLKKLNDKYTTMTNELAFVNDNRNTLDKMLDNRDREIDELTVQNSMLTAQVQLIYFMVYQEKKPEREVVRQALGIDNKGDNNRE